MENSVLAFKVPSRRINVYETQDSRTFQFQEEGESHLVQVNLTSKTISPLRRIKGAKLIPLVEMRKSPEYSKFLDFPSFTQPTLIVQGGITPRYSVVYNLHTVQDIYFRGRIVFPTVTSQGNLKYKSLSDSIISKPLQDIYFDSFSSIRTIVGEDNIFEELAKRDITSDNRSLDTLVEKIFNYK